MKFNPRYAIWKAASGDEARPVLTCVYFNAERATLSASDSYVLAEVPCVVEPGDTSCLIPAKALKKAAHGAMTQGNHDAQVTLADGYATFVDKHGATQRWPLRDGTFPDVVTLFDTNTAKVEEPFGLNHVLFGFLTRSLGFSSRGGASVRLHQTGPKKAVFAEGLDGARGLIMPVDLKGGV